MNTNFLPNEIERIETKGMKFRIIERNGKYDAQVLETIWKNIAVGYKTILGADNAIWKYVDQH